MPRPRARPAGAPDDLTTLALLALCAAGLAWLAWVALALGTDYYDAFENLLNAAGIAGHPIGYPEAVQSFSTRRAFLYPLLLSPLFGLAAHAAAPSSWAFAAAHAAAVVFTAVFGWATYRLLRPRASRPAALSAATLLLFSPLVAHLAVFIKEDVPGGAATALAIHFYLRHRESRKLRHALASAAFIACADGLRYNLIPLFPLAIGIHLLLVKASRRTLARAAFHFGALPVAAWALAGWANYALMSQLGPGAAARAFFGQFYAHALLHVQPAPGGPPPWVNLVFLARAVTPPVFLAGLAGAAVALRRRDPVALFHGLWIALLLLVQSTLVSVKAARLLIPLLPSFYFFALAGASWLCLQLERRRVPRLATIAALALWPAAAGLAEGEKFLDPFYRATFMRDVSRLAAGLTRTGRIVWIGQHYPLHPREYVFDPDDQYAYIDHFSANAVMYFSGKPVFFSPVAVARAFSDPVTGALFPEPPRLADVRDGDAVIVNGEAQRYTTATLPPLLKPLVVERARVTERRREARVAEGARTISVALPPLPALSAAFLRFADGLVVPAALLPAGPKPARFELPDERPKPRAALTGLELVTFEEVRRFEPLY